MLIKTEEGKKIRKYYVKLESIYNETIKEELEEQKRLLKNKSKNDELKTHKFLIDIFRRNPCVYVGKISENLIKIGSSNDIESRLSDLKRTYGNFINN